MTPSRFKRRTHALRLPEEIQKKYEEVCQRCEVCSRLAPAPSRSRVGGLRAQEFGDLLFIDHTNVQVHGKMGIIFVILDGATNLPWARAQPDERNETTLQSLRDWMDQYQCRPRGILADMAFSHPTFERFYRFHGVRFYSTGPRTPWPNRAETAIRVFKRQYQFLTQFLQEYPTIPNPTLEQVVQKCVWARNNQLTVSGKLHSNLCLDEGLFLSLTLKHWIQQLYQKTH